MSGNGALTNPSTNQGPRPAVEQRSAFTRMVNTDWLRSQGVVYLILLVVVVVFALEAPGFATSATMANIGRQAAGVLVVAVGMTLVIVCAEIDLSVGSTVSLSAAVVGELIAHGWGWGWAMLVALAAGGAVGLVNGVLVGYLGVPSFLVTLGMLQAVAALAQMITNTTSIPITSPTYTTVFGNAVWLGVPAVVWWALVVCVIGGYVLHGSLYGKWAFATGGNRAAAVYSGIRTRRVVLLAFVLSGVLAAFGGLLFAGRFAAGDPNVGNGLELSVIAAVILGGTDLFGGRGSILGSIIGALFIGIVGIGLILMGANAQLQMLITGAIIVVAVTINRLASRRRQQI